MNINQKEIMLIAQEECAEVIQAISKVFRFGMDSVHPVTMKANKESLEEEVGDLLCMIQMMIEQGIIDKIAVDFAIDDKSNKIRKWSNILNDSPVTTN
jgi:NTP pyrophosphatase (non-canonical NTP hydrolase)